YRVNPLFEKPYELPYKQWKRLANKHMLDENALIDSMGKDVLGSLALRLEIRDYLARTRSVICDPDQIVIYPDTLSALDSIARLLTDRGSKIAAENPTYQRNLNVFRAHNLEIHPLDVDEEGACLQQLETIPNPPRMIYVTPAHNNPLGTQMSL